MASTTQTVVRYSALLAGIVYGFSHSRTLQAQADEHAVEHANARRAQLIKDAKAAWAAKQAAPKKEASGVITDPEDPKFDLEKLIESWAAKA